MRIKKKIYIMLFGLLLGYFVLNAIRVYRFSFEYHENRSDVAIVLGAGTNNQKLSPVFKERVNHSILLYRNGIIDKIIFTGGFGVGQQYSDSYTAKSYALANGVPENDIFIEETSNYTIENLEESKRIMAANELKHALLVSDPLHMLRAIKLAQYYEIDCRPSPTKTTMYRSTNTRAKQLLYETVFFSLREPLSVFKNMK